MSSDSSSKANLLNSSSNSSSIDSTRSANTDNVYAIKGEREEELEELNRDLYSFISRVTPSVEDTMSHRVVLDLVRDVARRVLDPSADIEMFGSAASGLCERGSDIDATVMVDFGILNKRFHGVNRAPSVGHEARTLCSEAVCAIAKYIECTNGTGLAVEGLINGAKVPIVVLSSFGRQIIDVSINNVLPTYNTRLLGAYAKLDKRVVALVLCVKRWAKMVQVSDAKMGNLSSYSWSILCLYYLQQAGVIPSLQAAASASAALERNSRQMYHCPSTGKKFDIGFSLSPPKHDVDESCQSSLSAAELLCGFFSFYDSEFRWGAEVVSIRLGARKNISDPEFTTLSQGSRSMTELPPGIEKIHIEDPFDLSRNLHCVMDTGGLVRLRNAFRDIATRLAGVPPVSVLSNLAKTLMSYRNVVPAFATAELHKRYNGVGMRGATSKPISSMMGPLDESIVRNYARQQEILQRQLINLQQGKSLASRKSSDAGPGRGSYQQILVNDVAAFNQEWTTVDLW